MRTVHFEVPASQNTRPILPETTVAAAAFAEGRLDGTATPVGNGVRRFSLTRSASAEQIVDVILSGTDAELETLGESI